MNHNAAKTHCKHGHEYTPETTLIRTPKGRPPHRQCRTCKREQENTRYPRYKERRKKGNAIRQAKRRALNPEAAALAVKRHHIKSDFGLTLEEHAAKLDSQDNLCALCHRPFEGKGKGKLAPVLDHCHATGINREFLHSKCNLGIGHFDDDPVLLRLAAEYLEKHQGENLCTNQKESPGENLEIPTLESALTPTSPDLNPVK